MVAHKLKPAEIQRAPEEIDLRIYSKRNENDARAQLHGRRVTWESASHMRRLVRRCFA